MEELEFTTTTVLYRDAGPVIDDVSLTVVSGPALSIQTSHIERCWDSRTYFSLAIGHTLVLPSSFLSTRTREPVG